MKESYDRIANDSSFKLRYIVKLSLGMVEHSRLRHLRKTRGH
jgi:hypothetical protein